MARYFFNIYHDTVHWDLDGEELSDKHAAWKEATVMAGQMLQGLDGRLRPGHDWLMEVTDEFQECCSCLDQRAEAEVSAPPGARLRRWANGG
jgi:hypothetical protein